MKNTLLLLVALLIVIHGFSQDKQYVTETDTHIFWQPDRKLTAADFQYDGSDHPESIIECDSLGYCVVGAFGLFHVLDVTKGKYKPGKYREKLYIAPAFQKTLSCIFKEDSLGIEIQQVVFDIEELKARTIRYKIDHFYEKVDMQKPDNPNGMIFNTIYDECDEYYGKMKLQFLYDVVYGDRESEFQHWRKTVDEELNLEILKGYETTPEDCYRFVMDKPIEKKMVEAEYLAPSVYKKNSGQQK